LNHWIILELSEKGESLLEDSPEFIENLLKRTFKETPFFIPIFYDKKNVFENRIFLFKGYVFIKYFEKDISIYFKTTNTFYFKGPLLAGPGKLHLLPEDQILKMKKQLHKKTNPTINIGDRVIFLDGKYKNLRGYVTESYPKEKVVDISIRLQCMSIIVPKIPIVWLKSLTEKIDTSFEEKLLTLLKSFSRGLNKKQILEKMSIKDKDKPKLIKYLTKCIKEGLLKIKNKNNIHIFIHKNFCK